MLTSPFLPRLPIVVILVAGVLLILVDLVPLPSIVDPDTAAIFLVAAVAVAALMLLVGPDERRRLRIVSVPRLAAGIAVSVVATLMALAGAELAARWLFRDITTTSDDRGYFSNRWSAEKVQFNSLGYREREFSVAKPAGTYRIAIVGDSFTFGNGIDANDRLSALLQSGLGEGFEVLNFGMPGNNTLENAHTISNPVRRVQPDFVLVQWFINDAETGGRGRPDYRPLLPYQGLHAWLQHDSALYTLLDSWWTRRQVLGLQPGSYADYMSRRFADPQSQDSLTDRLAMRELFRAARSLNAGLGIVMFPDTGYELDAGYPFQFLHERLQALCEEERVTCVDLRGDFAAVKNRRALWANRLDAHPSAQANAIAAAAVSRAFEEQWLTRRH